MTRTRKCADLRKGSTDQLELISWEHPIPHDRDALGLGFTRLRVTTYY